MSAAAPRGDVDADVRGGPIALVSDAHIDGPGATLDDFLAFLGDAGNRAARVVMLGDIFALWLGAPKYCAPHHAAVLDACRALRRRGTEVVFIEGNRDFFAGRWRGDAFDEVGLEATAARGGRRWLFAHGDLLDPEDRAARNFSRVVRSRFVKLVGDVLPTRAGLAVARRIEADLRHRNMARKTSVPRERLARYADWFAARGFDAGAIGHVHVEMALELPDAAGRRRELFVLPDWRTTHRFLLLDEDGEPRFAPWGPPRAVPPAALRIVERDGVAEIDLDAPWGAAPGDRVAASSGHGPEVRRGVVLAVGPRFAKLRLEPGPPLEVGDRLVREDGAAENDR